MTKAPYLPVVALDVMPAHAVASMPHTVPNSVPIFSASLVTASDGTQDDDATMFSHSVALGVGGSASAASHKPAVTAGHWRGTLDAVYEFMEMLGLAVSAAVPATAVARAWKSFRGVTVVPETSTRPEPR